MGRHRLDSCRSGRSGGLLPRITSLPRTTVCHRRGRSPAPDSGSRPSVGFSTRWPQCPARRRVVGRSLRSLATRVAGTRPSERMPWWVRRLLVQYRPRSRLRLRWYDRPVIARQFCLPSRRYRCTVRSGETPTLRPRGRSARWGPVRRRRQTAPARPCLSRRFLGLSLSRRRGEAWRQYLAPLTTATRGQEALQRTCRWRPPWPARRRPPPPGRLRRWSRRERSWPDTRRRDAGAVLLRSSPQSRGAAACEPSQSPRAPVFRATRQRVQRRTARPARPKYTDHTPATPYPASPAAWPLPVRPAPARQSRVSSRSPRHRGTRFSPTLRWWAGRVIVGSIVQPRTSSRQCVPRLRGRSLPAHSQRSLRDRWLPRYRYCRRRSPPARRSRVPRQSRTAPYRRSSRTERSARAHLSLPLTARSPPVRSRSLPHIPPREGDRALHPRLDPSREPSCVFCCLQWD